MLQLAAIILAITCWPNETGDGNCDVSVEYELQQDYLELADVSIRIPIPSGVGAPVVGTCDGDYSHDSRKNFLEWKLDVIGKRNKYKYTALFINIYSDSSNSSGTLEFSIAGNPDDFFPVNVSLSFDSIVASCTNLD